MTRWFLLVLLSVYGSLLPAATNDIADIPLSLRSWSNWVLKDETGLKCPFVYNKFQSRHCVFPSRLALTLEDQQGHFESFMQVYEPSWVFLPGNKNYWPQKVNVNDQPALVMSKNGIPSIYLDTGNYQLTGEFIWNQLPDMISIPKNTGIVELSVNGKLIQAPVIKKGAIWIKAEEGKTAKVGHQQNKLDIQVFRKIYDGIPMQITTLIELDVSGEAREINLSNALLSNFVPVLLRSSLPASIESDGKLRIQVRPGHWQIEMDSRSKGLVKSLIMDRNDTVWPEYELWSMQMAPELRVVQIENSSGVDPTQTNIPKKWKHLPAYLIKPKQQLQWTVVRRGDTEPEPNHLSLKRKLWLDFDGKAYTVSDEIKGTMTKGWRINALPEIKLGQAKLNGINQLITSEIDDQRRGVEVRQGRVDLRADSRLTGEISNLSAVGWEENFHQVETELNLPPGWKLFMAFGVDNVPDSWVTRWTLMDFFMVLIAAFAVARLWNVRIGILALLTLSLIWHEPGAPKFIWLNLLAAIALIRVVPKGRFMSFAKVYRSLCWLVLLLISIPFMVNQIRVGLYPQLESLAIPFAVDMNDDRMTPLNQPDQIAEEADSSRGYSVFKPELYRSTAQSAKTKVHKKVMPRRVDPNANIQTGPGLPDWQWKKIYLSWTGPVNAEQRIDLWYLSPTVSMFLNVMRVVSVCVFSLTLLGVSLQRLKNPRALAGCFLMIIGVCSQISDSFAEIPGQALLEELKNHLLKPPECLPECAQISMMQMSMDDKELSIDLHIHAQQQVTIPLPAKLSQWLPQRLLDNNKKASAIMQSNDGILWLSVDQGIHHIRLQGQTPVKDRFVLPIAVKPKFTQLNIVNWRVDGMAKPQKISEQLIFTRTTHQDTDDKGRLRFDNSALPAFISVERKFYFDLDWRISTRLIRIAQNNSAVAIKFPLLNGESLVSEHVNVENGHAIANLSAGQNSLTWESVLEKNSVIDLQAANNQIWTEIWRVDVSPTWHLQASGIPVIYHQGGGNWLPEWRPWPGEKIRLTLTRPQAVEGSTLTIDKSHQRIRLGKRSMDTQLDVSIRSSKGAQHTIKLPADVELQFAEINGVRQPIRQKQSLVTLPIQPGLQTISLSWLKPYQSSMLYTSDPVDLGVESVNTKVSLIPTRDRWVLLTSGPALGPAVLFWGVLIVIILLGIGLGYLNITPLNFLQWILLFIGLSQIPVVFSLLVVSWLFALGIREKHIIAQRLLFNLAQVGLGLLTIVSLAFLFFAVKQGLLGSPNMQIAGNHSSAYDLNWYQDRSAATLPTVTMVSVPLMVYRGLMLLWSLWLAFSLLDWLKWGWQCFSSQGLWKKKDIIQQG